MKFNFGRIGVLYGGPSSEREISLLSGERIYHALKEGGHEVILIDAVGAVEEKITAAGISVAFIALHGEFGEDGTVQEMLDSLGIPYTGSGAEASRRAMDKILAKKLFLENGIPTPEFEVAASKEAGPDLRQYRLNLPLVVKPARQGSSLGVSIVRRKEDLPAAVEAAFNYDKTILLERYIEGKEVTAGIVEDRKYRALPLIEIVSRNEFFNFDSKYSSGGARHIIPPRLEDGILKRIENVSLDACRVLGCAGLSRVDLRVDPDGNPFVLEINTIPGMTETSLVPDAVRAAGMSFTGLCEMLLEYAYTRHDIPVRIQEFSV